MDRQKPLEMSGGHVAETNIWVRYQQEEETSSKEAVASLLAEE